MGSIATLLPALAGVSALAVVIIVLRAMPRTMFTLWSLTLFFVPVWIGVSLSRSFSVMASSAVTLLGVVVFGGRIRLSIADLFMAILVFFATVQYVLHWISLTWYVTATVEWLLPYIWGRIVLSRVSRSFVVKCIAVCATVAAVLAIIESVTSVNIFVLYPFHNSLYEGWGTLQERAGSFRAEGAWGHSIALGAALGMSSSFVLAAPWKPVVRFAALGILAVGEVLTLSRIGLGIMVLVIVLTVVLMPQIGKTTRIGVTVMGLVGGVLMMPMIMSVFSEAGNEAAGSADYRGEILSLFRYVKLFSAAPSLNGVTVGGEYLGAYAKTIDNAILLTGLRFGWIVLFFFCAVLAAIMISLTVRGLANPASIAVSAQVPLLLAVALITQFGTYFWFLAGLAVAWNNVLREPSSEDPELHSTAHAGGVDEIDKSRTLSSHK